MKKIKLKRFHILIIFLIVLILGSFILLYFSSDINQVCDIFFNSITGNIDIDKQISENEILLGITDVYGEGIIINSNDEINNLKTAKARKVIENKLSNC